MPKYSVSGRVALANPNTLLGITRGASRRGKIYDFMIGSQAAPADVSFAIALVRSTVAGTGGTAITPRGLDPDESAAVAACQEAPTAEPTYTANSELMEYALNLRATWRWVAAPDGELIWPDTAANGIGVLLTHASDTSNVDGTVHFSE